MKVLLGIGQEPPIGSGQIATTTKMMLGTQEHRPVGLIVIVRLLFIGEKGIRAVIASSAITGVGFLIMEPGTWDALRLTAVIYNTFSRLGVTDFRA